MTPWTFQALTFAVLGAPLFGLLGLGLALLLARPPSEKSTARFVRALLGSSLLGALLLAAGALLEDKEQILVSGGPWFELGPYRFELEFLLDGLSLTFALLTLVLGGIVSHFSSRYLHREPGYQRFFLFLLLFVSGMLVLSLAGTVDLLFFGWELVGVSSALLIAFFQRRRDPVENGLRTFAVYRFTDVGLLAAAVLLHHSAHTSRFDVAFGQAHWPEGLPLIQGAAVPGILLLFLLAAMGKSAQVPFGGWLPRAMEGPTPSSAVFYGGISIHAGAFLLLRAAPLLDRSPGVKVVILLVGLSTALFGTFVGRVQADAKSQLAYAAMGQVGLIFVEIALGLRFLALLHIAGHASVRTLQFLRAPSVLQEFHRIQAGRGGELRQSGLHYELLLPLRLRRRLYALALGRGGVEAGVHRFLVAPLLGLAQALEHGEIALGRFFLSPPRKPASRPLGEEETAP